MKTGTSRLYQVIYCSASHTSALIPLLCIYIHKLEQARRVQAGQLAAMSKSTPAFAVFSQRHLLRLHIEQTAKPLGRNPGLSLIPASRIKYRAHKYIAAKVNVYLAGFDMFLFPLCPDLIQLLNVLFVHILCKHTHT